MELKIFISYKKALPEKTTKFNFNMKNKVEKMKCRDFFAITALMIFCGHISAVSAQSSGEFSWILQNPIETKDHLLQEKSAGLEADLIYLYNQFNEIDELEVNCTKTTSNGSYFKNYCHPVFIENAIKINRKNWRNGAEKLKNISELYDSEKLKVDKMNEEFELLKASNDKFNEILDEIQTIRKFAIMFNNKINGDSSDEKK